jgi:two-component system cell cycle sensor histidine kinase PleC
MQVVALAPIVDAVAAGDRGAAQALLKEVSLLAQPIALFATGSTQLQARLDDENSERLLGLYSILGVLLAGLIGTMATFVFLLVRQLREISSSNAELRRLSAQLADAKLDAEAANQAKSQFLAVMSHELRTPLNAILGFSEIIAKELLGPVGERRYRGYAQDINSSGAHLLSLVNDVLDLSRIEAGRYELHEEPLALGELIKSCFTVLRPMVNAGVSLTHGSLDGPTLLADGRAVRQMLLNLLSNAAKFTPVGGVVHVWLQRDERHLTILVRDSGLGMSAEDVAKALVPFNHVNSHVAREHKGAGLGLSITKRLIELHGGSLAIDSAFGQGTTVRLAFPAARVQGAAPGLCGGRAA